jgi:nucleotide-binding universal stress UspA family protein
VTGTNDLAFVSAVGQARAVDVFHPIDFVIFGWAALGCALMVFMLRRGHSPTRWALLSFGLGPLAIPLALWARRRSGRVRAVVKRWGVAGPGRLSILVGLDGGGGARAVLDGVTSALGSRIGPLTLAYVVDYETGGGRRPSTGQETAEAELATEGERVRELTGIEPRTVVLTGPPAKALADYADANGVDWVVIGADGQGEAGWLRGSTATALSESVTCPVMIIGGRTTHRAPGNTGLVLGGPTA